MKLWIVGIVALVFAASANAGKPAKKAAEPPPSPFANVYRDATVEEIESIREALQERLKDADSAKFRNVRVIGTANELCGDVNAKNGMGAYSGYSKFNGLLITNQTDHVVNNVQPGKSSAYILFVDDETNSAATAICKKKGI